MDTARLQELGLTVRGEGAAAEVDLELVTVPLVNPLTRKFITKATFRVDGERLVSLAPPELVGLTPLSTHGVARATDLENQLNVAFNEHIFHLQRRSAELQALGLPTHVDPGTLQLSSEIRRGDFRVAFAANRRGAFQVVRAKRGATELDVSAGYAFELSEFRERAALEGYLVALFGGDAADAAAPHPVAEHPEPLVQYSDLAARFGQGAMIPPKSAVEVLVRLRVNGAMYRFAAARIVGRSFRGLLAGAQGKLWAERFELDQFPGVTALVADVLNVPLEAVEMLGAEET